MEVVDARIVWSAASHVLMLLREPTPPWRALPVEADPLVAVLAAVDEDGRETGEVAGMEIVGFLWFERWDGIPEVPGLWRLPDRKPEPFLELLKGEQRELRRAYRERGPEDARAWRRRPRRAPGPASTTTSRS